MKKEYNAQEELKIYLNRVLSLRPAKDLSPLPSFIFKLGAELMQAIGEDAGHICDRKRYLQYFYGLELKNNSAEVAKVLDIILEGIEWINKDSTLWEWESDEHKDGIPENLGGETVLEVFSLAMLTDEEIKDYQYPEVLTNLKSIGIEVKPRESIKPKKEEHNVVSPEFDVWIPLEKLAKEANSDFFDNVSDETLNIISDSTDFLDEVFDEYLGEEEHLKNIVRGICPNNFAEKWKLFLKVVIQAIYNSNILNVQVDEIAKLLPFVSDMKWIWDTMSIKINRVDPKLIYLFGNVGADEYGHKEGWFTAWWD